MNVTDFCIVKAVILTLILQQHQLTQLQIATSIPVVIGENSRVKSNYDLWKGK